MERGDKVGLIVGFAFAVVVTWLVAFSIGTVHGRGQAYGNVLSKIERALFDSKCWEYGLDTRSGKIEIIDHDYSDPCWKQFDYRHLMRLKNTMSDASSIY